MFNGNAYPEPGEHELFGREFRASDLVVNDERPDEAEDQFQVAIDDIKVACFSNESNAHDQLIAARMKRRQVCFQLADGRQVFDRRNAKCFGRGPSFSLPASPTERRASSELLAVAKFGAGVVCLAQLICMSPITWRALRIGNCAYDVTARWGTLCACNALRPSVSFGARPCVEEKKKTSTAWLP